MPIFHLTAQALGRRAGRSAVAAAAYRAGVRLVDQRTGQAHDFTRRRGVLWSSVYTPSSTPAWVRDREALWNAAELAEVRSDARTAREIEVALPVELTPAQRLQLAQQLASELTEKHQVAVDLALHAPGRGDDRNFHAHLLFTTRELNQDGFSKKTREWDDRKAGPALVTWWRARWAELINAALDLAGRPERVDHRSLTDQGIDRSPQVHLGPHAAAVERRTGHPSRRRHAGEVRTAEVAALQDARTALRRMRTAVQDELAAELEAAEATPRRLQIADIAAANQAAATRRVPPPPNPKKGKNHDAPSPR